MSDLQGVRVLAVHAHPDDESLWTGLALAQWARRGAEVTVVTCTLGEEGEVIGEKYAGLVADGHDILGGYRIAELQRALGELGLGRPVFLGGPGQWRDSGMVGTPAAEHPAAFVSSGAEAVEQITAVFDELRPHVVVTYGPDGGYGHPDHIRAHEIVHAAADAAAGDRDAHWVPARIYWAVQERERVEAGLSVMREAGDPPADWRWPEPGELASVPTASVDVRVVAGAGDLEAKRRAMAAHATQLWVADGSASDVNDRARESGGEGVPTAYCLSNLVTQPLLPSESYMIGSNYPAAGLSSETLNRLDCLFAEGR
ncbi:MAG TPA: N-acetyl-1-D-myo-inositol-2-amino-2-deoxy-alpha-D-glucopyranoside deacetylase [Candidatus Corynebacterium avicola]|uniref:1D-myo-inositol 2-acetamido-2-deoxy-alpha-D-glucopyranoside deacetylase n=1 Tax=Candidatus Corynebacterium avicola TaxID=2838527 RepID=A0A9D1RKN4_9CORY|nr:N-acetyl-1-D-myo-inositol-2-amino-2-deoxy-alpha-D-glucopyranoside deacetylase [Candidatus Corynebacterium avicola]